MADIVKTAQNGPPSVFQKVHSTEQRE